MFKSARWKSDKNKTKVVFKLQFQAFQVPQLGWDSLMVSLIPVDVGKPTVRSEKASVRDGTCRWENPIYEAVKFIQEAKTGKYNEKIYKLIVSSGSSKAILGEVTIDFSDYAEAVKATSISFPIKNSNSGAVLHVVIHRMHGDVERRDFEENGDITSKSQDVSLKTTALSENAESNSNVVAARGFEATSTSGSESSSERNTPRELGLKILMNNNVHQDPTSFLSSLSRSSMPHKRSNTEWSVGSAPDASTDDSTNSSEDNLTKERFPQASDLSVEKLKNDLFVLARQAEVSELELQTLRKQIVKESKKGQDLSREVVILKVERDSLKKECEQLKASQKHIDVSSKLQFEGEGSTALLKELRQELNHEKDLNANLRLQLQKTQESNSELILAVQDLDEMLEQKNREMSHLSKKSETKNIKETVPNHETSEDEEQQALEGLIKEHDHAKDAYLLEQKIVDLYSEIDVYRRDRDELEMQMEQIALDYEILKQENHDLFSKLEQNQLQYQLKAQYELDTQVENLEKEVKNQEEEFSASLVTINELETQVKHLEKKLRNQEEEFSASLTTINELETEVKRLEKQLTNQEEEFSASLTTINELETQVKRLEEQLMNQEEEFSASLTTINELETQVTSLETELKNQKEEFSSSLTTINELETLVTSLETELKNQKEEFSSFLTTINELETQVTSLETELKNQEEESSASLAIINELESQVKSLEKELEKQAHGFVADLEDVTRAKVEQEKRAILAEEALRKTRWANANTAERLQEEFRRLSVQMASTFDANEKLAMRAVEEANEIRLQKIHLEELLEKANEEIGLVKNQYEEKVKKLSDQIDLKKMQSEKMLLEVEHKSKKLENQHKHEEEIRETFSKEILMLKTEIERLTEEKNELSELEEQKEKLRADMELMKTSSNEIKLLVQTGTLEKDDLERRIASVRKEAEKSLEELNTMRSLKDEKETKLGILQSEVETLRGQYNDLRHSLVENELEKENLKKQVSHLRSDLQKKEDVLLEEVKLLETQIQLKETALEKSKQSFLEKEKDLCNRIEELEKEMEEHNQTKTHAHGNQSQKIQETKDGDNIISRNNESGWRNMAEKLLYSQRGAISTPNGIETRPIKSRNNEDKELMVSSCNGGQSDLKEMLREMELLKKRNKSMEGELKDMQERYSEISLKFAEVEGERQQLVMTVRNLKNSKKI